jgi:meiotically up-regulated gene 157 (Mug157) protein
MQEFDWQNGRPVDKNFVSPAVERIINEAQAKIPNSELLKLFSQAFPNTLDTTVKYQLNSDGQPDTYVITGDIDAMWLRDSTAQVWSYLALMREDKNLQNLIAGVINRQAHYIRIDPYANAFNYADEGSIWESDDTIMKPQLHERKWEIDSLCYHVRLAYEYWQITQDRSVFTHEWLQTATLIYTTFKNQQLKDGVYNYTFQRNTPVATDTLADHGLGNPVNPVGLIASSFRPSDDATVLPFLIPANFFAVDTLNKIAELLRLHYNAAVLARNCIKLNTEIKHALNEYAIATHKKYGKILCYEVDGFGSHLFMDDANVPSLISLPYLGCIDSKSKIYENTRKFILSHDNPWYFTGKAISGVGSIHTGRNKVWPIAVIMQGLTATNAVEVDDCLDMLLNSHNNSYFMHESIDRDNQVNYSRPWFAWANSLFAELVIKRYNLI